MMLALTIGRIPGITGIPGLREAAAIGIIGAADGPTSIYVAARFAPALLARSLWLPTRTCHWYRLSSHQSFELSRLVRSA